MTRQDLTDTVSTGFAALAIVIQVLLALLVAIALAALVFPPARRLLVEIRELFFRNELWMAWGVALVATLGSLFFSEYAHFIPCRLCWFQRIAMYPLAIILLVAALRRDARAALQYAIVFPVVGALIAIYHIYIEIHPEAESAGCKVGASCATKWINEFGYVTIPVLSLTAFATILALLLMAWSRRNAAAPIAANGDSTAEPS